MQHSYATVAPSVPPPQVTLASSISFKRVPHQGPQLHMGAR